MLILRFPTDAAGAELGANALRGRPQNRVAGTRLQKYFKEIYIYISRIHTLEYCDCDFYAYTLIFGQNKINKGQHAKCLYSFPEPLTVDQDAANPFNMRGSARLDPPRGINRGSVGWKRLSLPLELRQKLIPVTNRTDSLG